MGVSFYLYTKGIMPKPTPTFIAKIVVLVIVGIALGGFLIQWLWNWLMPDLFGLPEVSIWQAYGILVLSRILFGGFPSGGGVQNKKQDHTEAA